MHDSSAPFRALVVAVEAGVIANTFGERGGGAFTSLVRAAARSWRCVAPRRVTLPAPPGGRDPVSWLT